MKKSIKKTLVSTLSVATLTSIIATTLLITDVKNNNIDNIDNSSSLNNPNKVLPTTDATVLTRAEAIKLGWQGKADGVDLGKKVVTLDDWRNQAPHVTVIQGAFWSNGAITGEVKLEKVYIPKEITLITGEAFYGSWVSEIIFEKGSELKELGYRAFAKIGTRPKIDLSGLKNLKIIGDNAFGSSSDKWFIPDSVDEISNVAFMREGYTLDIREVSMPFKFKEYDHAANNFYGLKPETFNDVVKWRPKPFEEKIIHKQDVEALGWDKKTEITQQDWEISAPNVIEIGSQAFWKMANLKIINIPDKIESIGFQSFTESGLKSFNHNNKIKLIKETAFSNCKNLVSFSWPSLVKEIPKNTFRDCNSLTSINGIEGITSIEADAFNGTGLTSIELPGSLLTIGNQAFSNSKLTSIDIPNTIEKMGNNVFNGCIDLKTVSWPNSIKEIPVGTFMLCNSLTSINGIEGITSIGTHAFHSVNLTTIELPNSLLTIGSNAFDNSKLRSIYIPDSVTSIGVDAFRFTKHLTDIWMPMSLKGATNSPWGLTSEQVIQWRPKPFEGKILTREAVLVLGWNEKTEITKNDWEKYAPNVIEIGTDAFKNYADSPSLLEKIFIPDKIEIIGMRAFIESKLSTIEISKSSSLKEIKTQAFQESLLKSIYIPDSVTSIGSSVFSAVGILGENIHINRKYLFSLEPKYGISPWSWPNIDWRGHAPLTDLSITNFNDKITFNGSALNLNITEDPSLYQSATWGDLAGKVEIRYKFKNKEYSTGKNKVDFIAWLKALRGDDLNNVHPQEEWEAFYAFTEEGKKIFANSTFFGSIDFVSGPNNSTTEFKKENYSKDTDLSKYIEWINNFIKITGSTNQFKVVWDPAIFNELKALGLKLEWSYWIDNPDDTSNSGRPFIRQPWTDAEPTSVAILNPYPNEEENWPIAIRIVKIKESDKINMYDFTNSSNVLDMSRLDSINMTKGYLPDINLKVIIDFKGKIEEYKVKGLDPGYPIDISMIVTHFFAVDPVNVSPMQKEWIEPVFSIGSKSKKESIIMWSNLTDFKKNITDFFQESNRAKWNIPLDELNIFMKLQIKKGKDVPDGEEYKVDPTIAEIYINEPGVGINPLYSTDVTKLGKMLRNLTLVTDKWFKDVFVASGPTPNKVKITYKNSNNPFDFHYFKGRGIQLEINTDGDGVKWTKVLEEDIDKTEYDTSKSKDKTMGFRLSVIDKTVSMIKESPNHPDGEYQNGERSKEYPLNITAPTLLVGLKADNLTQFIKLTGSIHKLSINEQDGLFNNVEANGKKMTVAQVKELLTIKYTYDGIKYYKQEEFKKVLAELKGNDLNNFNLKEIKARYIFINPGQTEYYSPEVFNSVESLGDATIKVLSTNEIIKSIDLGMFVNLVEEIKITGELSKFTIKFPDKYIENLGVLGVKIQWQYWIIDPNNANEFKRSDWSDKEPTEIAILNPKPTNDNYPIAIRFVKIDETKPLELYNLNSTSEDMLLENSINMTKGYGPDVSGLKSIIHLTGTLEDNYRVSGIRDNINETGKTFNSESTAPVLDQKYLELKFAIGTTENNLTIDWLNLSEFKSMIENYSKEILRSQLNIFMKLFEKKDNNLPGTILEFDSKSIATIYSGETGVLQKYSSDYDENNKFLRAISYVEVNWDSSLTAEGLTANDISVISSNSNFIEYYNDRGIVLKYNVDGNLSNWTPIIELPIKGLDVSKTKIIKFKLEINEINYYQMKGTAVKPGGSNPGSETEIVERKITVPSKLIGLNANNLTFISLGGSTNQLTINEPNSLFKVEGMTVEQVKEFLTIEYTYDGTSYYKQEEFKKVLAELKGNGLNKFDLNGIKARYVFINPDQKEYYSPEIFGSILAKPDTEITKLLNTNSVIKTLDLNEYIANVPSVKMIGTTLVIAAPDLTILKISDLNAMGVKIQWQYWIDKDGANVRSEWMDDAPTKVSTIKPNELENPNGLPPIAIQFVKIDEAAKIELKNIVGNVVDNLVLNGYAVNVDKLKEVVKFDGLWGKNWRVQGISKDIMTTAKTLRSFEENVAPKELEFLEMQFALGDENTKVINWSNSVDFEKNVNKYLETKDILKAQLNIYAKLVLKTKPDGDVIDDIRYEWDKDVKQIYNSDFDQANEEFYEGEVSSTKLIVMARIKKDWAASLTAEGEKSNNITITSSDEQFIAGYKEYFRLRSIQLEAMSNNNGIWKPINIPANGWDTSKDNKINFRLAISKPQDFKMYSSDLGVVETNGEKTTIITKDVKAKIELTGISANDLITDLLQISGTTHDLTIIENEKLYTKSGMTLVEAKTIFEIKYSVDDKDANFKNATEFKKYLNTLDKTHLNDLNLANFKVRYEFTEKGKKEYWSNEIDVQKPLNTAGVVKTIDLNSYIKFISTVKLSGTSDAIQYDMGSLNTAALNDLKTLGVKIEWSYWEETVLGKYERSEWVDTRPSSVPILKNPNNPQDLYPIAIRFVKTDSNNTKIELKDIDTGTANELNDIKGYPPDLTGLKEVIKFDGKLGINWSVKGIAGNIIKTAAAIETITFELAENELNFLEMQFSVGATKEGSKIIDWSNKVDFKKNVDTYNKTNDILKSQLNIYMKLVLKDGEGPDGDVIGETRYEWDKQTVEIYNNTTGVNETYDKTDPAGSFLRVYARVKKDWSDSLSAEGEESTAVNITSKDSKFDIKYYTDRGINLEVNPTSDTKSWTRVTSFPSSPLDASITNEMQYRLIVTDRKFYEMYGDATIDSDGAIASVPPKKIIAKIELTGISASDLITDLLQISGTTHNLTIIEDPKLYTKSGMALDKAKLIFEIKYSVDGTDGSFKNEADFKTYLKTLNKKDLNILNLSNFKVRYEFTEKGQKEYWSREIFGDSKANVNVITKILNTDNVVKTLDLNDYIANVPKVLLTGETTKIEYDMAALDVNALTALGVKIEWDYWVEKTPGIYERAGWVDTKPSSVPILKNPANLNEFYPIAIRFVKTDSNNTKIELKDIDTGTANELNDIKGYEPNIDELKEIIKFAGELGTNWLVKGIAGNIIKTATAIDQETVDLAANELNSLEMQFAVGETVDGDKIIDWSNKADFKTKVDTYNETNDILKPQLNIFMKLILKNGTGTNGDIIDETKYQWDKRTVEIYNNKTGVNATYDKTDPAGSFLRVYVRVNSDWSDSLSAEGDESTAVKIYSKGSKLFDIKYYADRGIKLEVNPTSDTKSWTHITSFPSNSLDASKTNEMQYRLSVDPKFYEMYGTADINTEASIASVPPKKIIAKIELTGILANDLISDKLKISGTTHDLVIIEDDTLYTKSGMTLVEAKTIFEIKYSVDGTDGSFKNKDTLTTYLKTLNKKDLNILNLSNFKVRYEFTEKGQKEYWSREIFGDIKADVNVITKILNTDNVVKTLDLNDYIANVPKVLLTGETTKIEYDMAALDVNALTALGVKIEWDYWVEKTPGIYERAGWVDTKPSSVPILKNPANLNEFYPIAIRFVKADSNNTKIELKDIVAGELKELNDIKGYEPNINDLKEIIKFAGKLGTNWLVKGIAGNIIKTATAIDQETIDLAANELSFLEMQFAVGETVDGDKIIDWSNKADFKTKVDTYNETNDILKPQLNIFMKLILKNGTGTNGDIIDETKYQWDKRTVEIYNNTTGVNETYDKTDPAGSFLRVYVRVNSDWSDSLSAEGDESTAVKILSKDLAFDIEYYADRGIKLEVNPTSDTKSWTHITSFPSDPLDASKTNEMQYRLSVDPKFYEMYGTADINTEASIASVPPKKIIAKIELTGILANDLISDKLKISGTTHDLVIIEDDTLYTASGMNIIEAKTFFEIKYSVDGTDGSFKNDIDFKSYLNKLNKNDLNNLNPSNFKVRYEFTKLGQEKYWSREVFGDLKADVNVITKTLNTNNVIKTLDLNDYIANVAKVLLTGQTIDIKYDMSALDVDGLKTLGVTIEWDYWVETSPGKYKRAGWVLDKPKTIPIINNPENPDGLYPIAIRFSKIDKTDKLELKNIVGSELLDLDNVKGYEPNIDNLNEVIVFSGKIGTNWLVKGTTGNIITTANTIDQISVDISDREKESLEMQFSVGSSMDGKKIIDWSNKADFKTKIDTYNETNDILKSELNIYMKLILIGGTGPNNNVIDKVEYMWDSKAVEVYNNAAGVNSNYNKTDIAGSFLRALSKIQSTWHDSLQAEGVESTKVGIESLDNSFIVQYYTDRGIKFEVSPDAGVTWIEVKKLPTDKNIDASETNEMQYRLSVLDSKFYEMYSDVADVVELGGDNTKIITKPIKAKKQLVGVLASNLITDKLLITGTTHEFVIEEKDSLFQFENMSVSTAKTLVLIKYSLDSTNYLTASELTKKLNSLKGLELNELDLNNFKVRYEFTELGKEGYWSDQIFEGRADGVSPDVIKTLDTSKVIKTLDVTKEIEDITKIKVSGTTESLKWEGVESLDLITKYVKVEYGTYNSKLEYNWSTTRPTSLFTIDFPDGAKNYPLAIRFMPLIDNDKKVEIGSIDSSNIFKPSNTDLGYSVDLSSIVTIINIDTTNLGKLIVFDGMYTNLNPTQTQEDVELAAKSLVSEIFWDKIELRYELSIFPGEELNFNELKARIVQYSRDVENKTSGLLFFENGIMSGVTISASFISINPQYQINATPSNSVKLNTDKIITNVNLREYIKVLKAGKVEPTGETSETVGNLTIPPMPEMENTIFTDRNFKQIRQILSDVISIEFKAPGYYEDKWVSLETIQSINSDNELYIRFVVKENALPNIQLSLEGNNDWESFITNGIKLKVNLRKEIVTMPLDLIDQIKITGNTKNLLIDDEEAYTKLNEKNPEYINKFQILYSIGDTPMIDPNNPSKTEFTKTEFIEFLVNNKIDITVKNKLIKARYALAEGVSEDDWVIKDESVVTLNAKNVLLYIHASNYYKLAAEINVFGVFSDIQWSDQLDALLTKLSSGLRIQYTIDPTALIIDPNDSPKWVNKKITNISPNDNFLAIRFILLEGYIFEEQLKSFQIDLSKLREIIKVKTEWLNSIKLIGNTRNIDFDLTTFISTLKNNGVNYVEGIVVQYAYGNDIRSSESEWHTADKIKTIFEDLKGAKNGRELILLRDTLRARYTLSDEAMGKYLINIDGTQYLDQFPVLDKYTDLVTPTNNQGFEGYINMDLITEFTGDSFTVSGTKDNLNLNTVNERLIDILSYYKLITPFTIYYSNDINNWSNKTQIIFDEKGFGKKFNPDFEIKIDSLGKPLPIYFKLVGKPGYNVYEKNDILPNGKVITINNMYFNVEAVNPLTQPPVVVFGGYQGFGSFKVFDKLNGTEITPEFLNAQYPGINPLPLRLEYNVHDRIYEEDELKIVMESKDKDVWLTSVPKTLRVDQYVIVRVAVNNDNFQLAETNGSTPTTQIRVKGLMIHNDSLSIRSSIVLRNSENIDQPPVGGKSVISEAQVSSIDKYKDDYLGVDLSMSVDLEFYKNASGKLLICDGIPIIKRNQEGAKQEGVYRDELGKPILDSSGNQIPIWMIDINGVSIPADPLRTGNWRPAEKMQSLSNGAFSQINKDNEEWKLFQNQYVKFTFNVKEDFILDSSVLPEPEVKLTNIKYPIQMNGVEYRFEQIKPSSIVYLSDEGATPDNPNAIPFTGASHMSPETVVVAIRKDSNSIETILKDEEIEKQIKIDSKGLVKVQMSHVSPGSNSEILDGTDVSKIFSLKNKDSIKVQFVPTNNNFMLPIPFSPLIIDVMGLHAQAPSDKLFEYLRPDFVGVVEGGGSFGIDVTNPKIPSQINSDILGSNLWYEYQVWNSDKTLKTSWTKDRVTNLKNGDKVEWRLFNKEGVLNPDSYNTLIYPITESGTVRFRVVNVIDGYEETVKNGQGNSGTDNPDIDNVPQYPRNSGWVVSGLKIGIVLSSEEEKTIEKTLKSFRPLFNGVNGFGVMQSNINDNDLNLKNIKMAWKTSKQDGSEIRDISDFRKANLSNGDLVWVTIVANGSDLVLEEINKINSEKFVVSELKKPVDNISETVTIALVSTVAPIILIGLIAVIVFISKNKKIKSDKNYKG